MRKYYKQAIIFLSFILVLITTVAYSALSTQLAIISDVKFRVLADIRVTDIDYTSTSGGTLEYASEYTKNSITSGFTLPSAGSSISYTVTVTTSGNVNYAIYGMNTESTNNPNIKVLIDGQEVTDILPIPVPFGTSKNITITYIDPIGGSNPTNIINRFDFRRMYDIDYRDYDGTLIETQYKYENVDFTITKTASRDGYNFLGWSKTQSDTTPTYIVDAPVNNKLTIDDNYILYAIYKKSEFNVTFDSNGGTIPATQDYTLIDNNSKAQKKVLNGDPIGSLPGGATKSGYTFKGWYTAKTGGTVVTTTTVPTNNATYYAQYDLIDPAAPSITGGRALVYNYEDTTMTCSTASTYPQGVTIQYSFGYKVNTDATPSDENYSEWTSFRSSNIFTLPKTTYATRFYTCKIKVVDTDNNTSNIVFATNSTQMTQVNAIVNFDGNTGTISGSNHLFVYYNDSNVYSQRTQKISWRITNSF